MQPEINVAVFAILMASGVKVVAFVAVVLITYIIAQLTKHVLAKQDEPEEFDITTVQHTHCTVMLRDLDVVEETDFSIVSSDQLELFNQAKEDGDTPEPLPVRKFLKFSDNSDWFISTIERAGIECIATNLSSDITGCPAVKFKGGELFALVDVEEGARVAKFLATGFVDVPGWDWE